MTKTTTKVSKVKINQNELVIKYLRKSRKRLTSEQICEAVNTQIGDKKSRLTPTQISKCLNRFSEKNMVKKVENTGVHSTGRKISTWIYIKS